MNTKPLIYFKTYARENGCPEEVFGSDLAIWKWIQAYQKITVWERLQDKTKVWEHNHISRGYDANATEPTPRTDLQKKAWGGGTWKGTEARMNCYHEVLEPLLPELLL